MLKLKLSHRVDTPACLNAEVKQVVFENSTFIFEAVGTLSNQLINYKINFDLYDPVHGTECKYHMDSVGTVIVTLVKSYLTLWPNLTKERKKLHIWWDMKYKYIADFEEFVNLVSNY